MDWRSRPPGCLAVESSPTVSHWPGAPLTSVALWPVDVALLHSCLFAAEGHLHPVPYQGRGGVETVHQRHHAHHPSLPLIKVTG
jgi:hypothetical protein